MTRPRVLFVGRTRYRLPLDRWLAEKYCAIGRELDFHVLACSGTRQGGSTERFELVRPVRPRILDGPAFYLGLPFRVRRAIRRFRPDALIAEDPVIAAAAIFARRLAPGRMPVVAEVHGDWHTSARLYGSPLRRLLAPLADAIGDFGVRRADEVRALSPLTGRLVERVRGRPPGAEFPAYVAFAEFDERPPCSLPEGPTALFVGVLEPYKNVAGLVAAWRETAKRLPEVRLVVVGRGPLAPLVDELARELPGRVERVSELTPAEVAERMDAATALVLPSRSEGVPRVVLESFARGRSVVATRVGGVPELVRDEVEGLLVEPNDTAALADALVRVLSDRSLAEALGAAARRRADDWRCTPAQFASRLRELVEKALH